LIIQSFFCKKTRIMGDPDAHIGPADRTVSDSHALCGERGAPGEPVIVSVIDCNQEVLVAVAGFGRQPISGPWSSDLLGLYLVGETVREQGGRIELISDESATAFHVWLPKKGGLR